MKKAIKLLALILTVTCMTTTAYAVTPQMTLPTTNLPDFKPKFDFNLDWYFEEQHSLDTPKITDAKYVHSRFFFRPNTLEISWEAVKDAKEYEVEINYPDGKKERLKTEDTFLFERDIPCLKQKIDGSWRCATVRVRAKNGNKGSYWTKEQKITCNTLHH